MYITVTYSADVYKIAEKHKTSSVYFLHFDSVAVEDGTIIEAKEAAIFVKNATYELLVSAFIHVKYSLDDEIALVNNYVTDPAGYEEDYKVYQEWRKYCKEAARTIFPADADPEV